LRPNDRTITKQAEPGKKEEGLNSIYGQGGIVLAPKRPDHHKAGRAWKKGGRTVVSFRSKGSVCGQEPVVRSCGQFYAQSVKEYIKQRINAVGEVSRRSVCENMTVFLCQ